MADRGAPGAAAAASLRQGEGRRRHPRVRRARSLTSQRFGGIRSYTVHFYGIASTRLAKEFAAGGKDLLARFEQLLREQERFDDDEIRGTMGRPARIVKGKLPANCNHGYFEVLCWLAEVAGERVEIPCFHDFRRIQFLEDIGAWEWLLRSRPPFPVPVCREPPPEVGFMTAEEMKRALPQFDQLPAAGYEEASYARQELQKVTESLAEDGLDLLAVLL